MTVGGEDGSFMVMGRRMNGKGDSGDSVSQLTPETRCEQAEQWGSS